MINADKIEWSNTVLNEGILNENIAVNEGYSETALIVFICLVLSARYNQPNPFRWNRGYP